MRPAAAARPRSREELRFSSGTLDPPNCEISLRRSGDIAEIEAGGPDDKFYDAKVKVLSEMIEHHVKEEEQRVEGMFAQARKTGLDLDDLGQRMSEEKARLMAEYKASGVPTPETTTLDATRIGQA